MVTKTYQNLLIAAALVLTVSCTCGSLTSGEDSWGDGAWEPPPGEFPDWRMDWQWPTCGNGIVEPGEECDDGNRRDCDGCSAYCKVEPFECFGQDALSDGDAFSDVEEEEAPPPAPEALGDTVVVSYPPDDPGDGGSGAMLHVLWNGSQFSVIYHRQCPFESTAVNGCLAMRRFDETGTVLGPDWIYEPVELDLGPWAEIAAFDYCWDGDGYGLAWAEGKSVYFMRLSADGKPLGIPVKVCNRCLPEPSSFVARAVRAGCKEDSYLLTFNVEAGPGIYWLWLQELDTAGTMGEGAFLGDDSTNMPVEHNLRPFGSGWLLLHLSDMRDYDPPISNSLILESFTADFEFLWRLILDGARHDLFDYDVGDGLATTVFPEGDPESALLVAEVEEGILLSRNSLTNGGIRIASIDGGRQAVLDHLEGGGYIAVRIYVIDETGLASEPALVQVAGGSGAAWFSCYHIPYDLAWTGSQIGVVTAFPRDDPEITTCDIFLRMYMP